MSQTQAEETTPQQVTKRRVNFSDGNREHHLQVLYEWLPLGLCDAPLIDWGKLPSKVIGYLVNTVNTSPFAGHLALAAGATRESVGIYTLKTDIRGLNTLLGKVQALCGIRHADELTQTVWEIYLLKKKEITPGDYHQFKTYSAYTQHHLIAYLEQLTPHQRTQIECYILPRLPRRIQTQIPKATLREEGKQRRKEKSDVLTPLHSLLVALVRFRKQAAERMWQAFCKAKEYVQTANVELPFPFSYEDEDVTVNRDARTLAEVHLERRPLTMRFLLWDRHTWILKHKDDYSSQARSRAQRGATGYASGEQFFVQFLGEANELLWFGELIKYRLLHRDMPRHLSAEDAQYRNKLLEMMGVTQGLSCSRDGILTPGTDMITILSYAVFHTRALLFEPESLYRGVLYGSALATLALTNGSRMAELLQVSADRFKVRTYQAQKDGDATREERVMHLQLLLPKGKHTEEQRKLFLVSDWAYLLLCEIAQLLREAHHGHIPVVRPHTSNTKAEDLSPERYLFQWQANSNGQFGALNAEDMQDLLRFILHGLDFRTKQGEPFSVSVHLLRHVMATAARHEHEVPLEVVARALHHEHRQGVVPEATMYYSQETEEQALKIFATFQATLETWAASLLVAIPNTQDLEQMEDDLRESFERWHTLLETTFGFCGNVDLCPRGYNRTLCIGCPHLVLDHRKRKNALHWRSVYEQLASELEAQGNAVDAHQYRLLVRDLDGYINDMKILQASIEDGTRKPTFLLLASAPYEEVVVDAKP